jgi:hypothetical protein
MGLSSWLRNRTSGRAPCGRTQDRLAAARFRPGLEALEDRWLPSQVGLSVSSLADSGPGTLRAAIQTADAGSDSDKFTIGFRVTGTIDLQSPLPDLNNTIAIQGPGAPSLTVERAAGASFSSATVAVDVGQTTSLSGLTIANGNARGIENDGTLTLANSAVVNNSVPNDYGGAVRNTGTLTVSGCTLAGNRALGAGVLLNFGTVTISGSTLAGNSAGNGGGIVNFGTAVVRNSTLSGNSASGGVGGGIINDGVGTLTVSGSILSGNSGFAGGGIANGGTLTVSGSILSGNSASYGGGISNSTFGTLTVSGTTLSGNAALVGDGGGIANGGSLTVSGCTLSGNYAPRFVNGSFVLGGKGGGIYNVAASFLTVTVRDSLFTGNSAPEGGGIYNDALATLAVRNSTFSGNSAGDSGGGLFNAGTALLQQSTLSGNSATSAGGGLFNAGSGTLAVADSAVCDNAAPLGADLYNLGALSLNDSTVCVIGP